MSTEFEIEKNTEQDTGKPDRSGLYIVCNGAKCNCDQSKEKQEADLEVLSHNTTYINDKDGADKLVANTNDIGIPFKLKSGTFGSCLKQPIGTTHKPCIPNVISWEKAYESIILDNKGEVLVKESEGTCAFNGKITFKTHGQIQSIDEQDATEASISTELTPALTEEQVKQLVLGEFIKASDKKGASVVKIVTIDGERTYVRSQKNIQFKVREFSSNNPSEADKKGVNWAVFYKEIGNPDNKYKQHCVFSDIGEMFDFPYNTEGDFVVEAYGSNGGPFFLTKKYAASYEKITLKEQCVNELTVSVGSDRRTRVRLTESAIIKANTLFDTKDLTNNWSHEIMKIIGWEATAIYKGESVPVQIDKDPNHPLQAIVQPLGTKAKVAITAILYGGNKKRVGYTVGANYVVSIEADKSTVSIWESGEVKERNSVRLKVSKFRIEPATELEKQAVNWTNFSESEMPNKSHVIARGPEITRLFKTKGVLCYEAFSFKPAGGVSTTVKRIEGLFPNVLKAYWADGDGNRIDKSGFEHTVFIHIETEGLVGEKFKLNVWESDRYSSDFIKNAGTTIELTADNGIINQEFKLPESNRFEQEYYFTIEKLDFRIIATKQDSDSKNEYVLWQNPKRKKVHYLYVNNKKKITSLKIYESDGSLHTGIVKYGDTVTVKLESRNLVGKELTFAIVEDINWGLDKEQKEIIKIKVTGYGKGEATFTIPKTWEKEHGGTVAVPRYFYLRREVKLATGLYMYEEFPRS
ncbi:MAG: DUF4280 domain-containing protein, partial [Flavobacteriaceae bacterium]|nr:DUF4280 domain-containing protein [Flavobacteriaceae bacterium]